MVGAMVSRFLILLGLLLLPFPALAQSLEGHWAFRIDEATIFVFRLDERPGGTWIGAWKRPTDIASNGAVFQRMGGSEVVVAERSGERDGQVELVFAGPPGSTRSDVLRFRQTGDNQAQLTYVGIPGDPYPLIRVRPDTELGPFEETRIYDRDLAVVEAEYDPPLPEPEVPSGAALADAGGEAANENEAAALAAADDVAGEAEDLVAAADLAAPDAPASEVETLALEPLEDPVVLPAAEVWQPLGLIDDATAAAAARAAINGEVPAAAPEAAVEAVAPAAPDADAEAHEPPRIEADFLDGL